MASIGSLPYPAEDFSSGSNLGVAPSGSSKLRTVPSLRRPILTWTNVPTPSVFLLVLLLYLTRWRQAGCIWRGYSGAAYRFFFYTSCRWYYETWMFLNSCLPQWTPSKGMYGKYRTLIIWPHRGGNPSVMSSLYPTSQERPPQCYLLYTRPYRGNLGVKSALYPASQEATSV